MTEAELKDIAKTLGRQGGNNTLKKYGTEHFKQLSKKGVEARKRKGTDLIQSTR